MKTINLNLLERKRLPTTSGVYIYKDKNKVPIYVGKAKNIKSRVSSYFASKLEGKTKRMIYEADSISFIQVASEFEALLLEAKLVKKYWPQYNSALKDDKSPLYIGITKEALPRILELRQSDLKNFKLTSVFGPFISPGSVRSMLYRLRKGFPFSQHVPGKKACIRSQIGLCNPCPSDIVNEKDMDIKKYKIQNYRLNIRRIKAALSGNLVSLQRQIEKEMKTYSSRENFEEANIRLKQLKLLDYLSKKPISVDGYLKNPNLIEDIREKEASELVQIIKKYINIGRLQRIECFDIAHLAGTSPTASMVTFINGEPEKKFYRHFGIRLKKGNSDTDSMINVLERRMKHVKSWGAPDLIIVDGGKGQVGAAIKVLGNKFPTIGIAKREETLVFKVDEDFLEYKLPESHAKNLIQRIRDEAHRFARRYHHKLVSRELLSLQKK